MISDLMLYGTAIAALFALAGLAIERIAVWIGVARRGAWAATLVLSVAFPTMRVLAPHPSAPPPSTYVARPNPRSEEISNIATPAVRASNDAVPIPSWSRLRSTTWSGRLRLRLRGSFGPCG
jgi:hypothetical protein